MGRHYHLIHQLCIFVKRQGRHTDISLHFYGSPIGDITYKRNFEGIEPFPDRQGKATVGIGRGTDGTGIVSGCFQYDIGTGQRAVGFRLYGSCYGINGLGIRQRREQEYTDSHQHCHEHSFHLFYFLRVFIILTTKVEKPVWTGRAGSVQR